MLRSDETDFFGRGRNMRHLMNIQPESIKKRSWPELSSDKSKKLERGRFVSTGTASGTHWVWRSPRNIRLEINETLPQDANTKCLATTTWLQLALPFCCLATACAWQKMINRRPEGRGSAEPLYSVELILEGKGRIRNGWWWKRKLAWTNYRCTHSLAS